MGGIVFVVAVARYALGGDARFRCFWQLVGFVAVHAAAIGVVDDLLGDSRRRATRIARAGRSSSRPRWSAIVFSALASTAADAFFPRDVLFHAGSAVALSRRTGSGCCSGSSRLPGRFTPSISPTGSTAWPPARSFRRSLVFASIACRPSPARRLSRRPPSASARAWLSSIYNRHPAKMFMGDTGSLALGALLSGVAILERRDAAADRDRRRVRRRSALGDTASVRISKRRAASASFA